MSTSLCVLCDGELIDEELMFIHHKAICIECVKKILDKVKDMIE